MKILLALLQFLVFPGFLFTAVVGLLASWIDRKVTAAVQYRMGPPWYQPFADIVKLLGKETLIPAGGSRILFLVAPLFGLVGVTLVSMFLWLSNFNRDIGFIGDIIVAVYLLTFPALSLMLGGFASGNPYASLGASREMKMVLSYELPFILALIVPIIKSGGELAIGGILQYQEANGIVLGSLSGTLAFLAALLCMQAKLGLVPFDVSEAETELVGGPLIDYSGAPLAVFKLTKAMSLFTIPVFVIVLYMGGFNKEGFSVLWGIVKYVALLVVIVLLRNTNPRLRINQMLRFFWGPVTLVAVAGVILAMIGM